MARPLWFVELIKRGFPGRFWLAELTKVPVVGRGMDRWLFEGDDLVVLPRDRVIAVDESVEMPEPTALPSEVVARLVERAGVHWVMNTCICREASGCKDYPIDLGCLFLGEAALDIHPKLGRRVTQDEALQHLQRCREANLVHLVGRNKLDTIWLGVGPGDKLMTICSCCPCCCLWKVLPRVSASIRAKVNRMPGVRVTVTDKCVGCGTCAQDVCFVNAISSIDERSVIGSACVGCGRCASACPEEAIRVTISDEAFVQSTIERMSSLVDVF